MNRLPAELIDFIIDFHHSDKPTLKVCSLACRTWLPASRFHLFGTVIIRNDSAPSFVELLASPFSTIASHVHTLHIRTRSFNMPVFDIIAPHFKDFVALKSFSVEGRKSVPVSETSFSRAFGRIENMELTSISCNCVSMWSSFSFTLGGHGPSLSSSTLRILHSSSDNQPSSWLPMVVHLPTVGQLDLCCIRESDLPIIQAVLKSGGQSIHTIKLGFHYRRPGLAVVNCVDLTHNTNLRSLSISSLNLRDSKDMAGLGSFLKVIQRISSTSFAHIEIDVLVDDCEDLTKLDCKKLSDELNHARFPKLRKVCILIRGLSLSCKDEAAAFVRREMSSIADRGILTCLVKNYFYSYY